MAKTYKVWIEIEEYDDETDEYTSMDWIGPDGMEFDTQEEAKANARAAQAVLVGEDVCVHDHIVMDITSGRQEGGGMKYTVLLMYPDYANDDGTKVFLSHVVAGNPKEASVVARKQAVREFEETECYEPNDFAVLLTIEGHHFDVNN
jgi:hypothetical protein